MIFNCALLILVNYYEQLDQLFIQGLSFEITMWMA